MSQILNIEDIDERFFVRGRMEILGLLNDIIHRRIAVTVRFGNAVDGFATALLEAKESGLIFELSPDEADNKRLLNSFHCSFVMHPDGIRVQFLADHANKMSWGGMTVFSVPLPKFMVRMQRQQSFRVLIPAVLRWTVELFSDDGNSLGEWPLNDLSGTGLGLTVDTRWNPDLGVTIARARFGLPDYDEIDCAVMLRHQTVLGGVGVSAREVLGSSARIGLEFANLLPEAGVAIQRSIINIEHERRRLVAMGKDYNVQ